MKTVTIGIPAHNEEKNIVRLLDEILAQSHAEIVIEKILVGCDGCTDHTKELAEGVAKNDSRITVIHDNQRLGKAGRIAQFCAMNKSDILVCLDADAHLVGATTLEALATEFTSPKIGVVAAHDMPKVTSGIFAAVVRAHIHMWTRVRAQLDGGNNVHAVHGCMYAISRSVAATANIPATVVSDDTYIYLEAKRLGYQTVFAQAAQVEYQLPSHINEYFQQSARFLSSEDEMVKYFGEAVRAEFAVPAQIKCLALGANFIRSPFLTACAVVLQGIQAFRSHSYQPTNGVWTQISSSK